MSVLSDIEDVIRTNSGLTLFKRSKFDELWNVNHASWSGLVQTVQFVTYAELRAVSKKKMRSFMERLQLGRNDIGKIVSIRDDYVGSILISEVIGEISQASPPSITVSDFILPIEYELTVGARPQMLIRHVAIYVYPNRSNAAGVHGWDELRRIKS